MSTTLSTTRKTPRKLGRAVSVARVSKMNGRHDGDGMRFRSTEEQDESMDRKARQLGAKIVAREYDLDRSGGTMDRPGMNRAVAMVVEDRADAILVAKVDRFSRNVKEGLATLDLIESAGGYVLCGDFDLDTRDPNGRMMFVTLLNIAENFRNGKRVQLAETAAAATREGIRISPPPPGYLVNATRRLDPDPERAHLIPELFRRRAEGHSWAELRDWWHGETDEWLKAGTLSKMIKNRTYLGELSYGDVVSQVRHEALVDEALFDAAQGVRAPRRARSAKPKTLLAGIIKCGGCGRNMTPSKGGKAGVTIYRCQKVSLAGTKCKRPVAVVAARADEWVVERFLAWAGDAEEVTTGERDAEFAAADAAVDAAERELAAYMEAFTEAVGVERAQQGAASRLAAVEEAVAARDRLHAEHVVAGVRVKVRDRWADLDLEDRRRLLMAGIESVVVQPTSPTPAGGRPRLPFGDRAIVTWRTD